RPQERHHAEHERERCPKEQQHPVGGEYGEHEHSSFRSTGAASSASPCLDVRRVNRNRLRSTASRPDHDEASVLPRARQCLLQPPGTKVVLRQPSGKTLAATPAFPDSTQD